MFRKTNVSGAGAPRSGVKKIPSTVQREIGGALAFKKDPIDFLRRGIEHYGDIFLFRPLGVPMVIVNHPDHIRHILVDHGERYDTNALIYNVVRPVLRNGLIANTDIELWRRQRRMMAPHFTPRTVRSFVVNMTSEAIGMLDRWQRDRGIGAMLDVTDEFGQLALRVVNKSLFSAEVGATAQAFERAFGEANTILGAFFRFPFPPLSFPTPRHIRLRRSIGEMDAFVSEFVSKRIGHDPRPDEAPDLLSLLLHSVDEEDGKGMDLEQLHHEILNLCIGAYETTTNALSWAFYVIARNPDVENRLHAEVDRVLGGRVPEFEDIGRLTYTRMVIDEVLRMYTPAFQFMRRALQDDEIDGFHVPAGTNILVNSYFVHRHPDYWDDPERFNPERFTPQRIAERPKHAYIPFGSGRRICIGRHFALAELTLVLATIARGHRLVLPDGAPEPVPEALITLRPRGGVHLRLETR